ncbi:MAG: hypothetical protein C5S44_03775 [Candidatus Methanocomedens sp.]|nr:MAG: hypothetical protein C5S44_03775 [ANME-2 cluster archaeon]
MHGCKRGVLVPPPARGARPALLPARPCCVVAGRRFRGASQMQGFPTVPGCGVDVVLVSCQLLLKYISYEIMNCKEGKAMAVDSFAPLHPLEAVQ